MLGRSILYIVVQIFLSGVFNRRVVFVMVYVFKATWLVEVRAFDIRWLVWAKYAHSGVRCAALLLLRFDIIYRSSC